MAIEKKLIEEARKIGGYRTKEEATPLAEEDAAHRNRLRILSAFGTIDFDPGYDYKVERKKKRNPV